MADLDIKDSSQIVGIIGLDTDANETVPVKSTSTGSLITSFDDARQTPNEKLEVSQANMVYDYIHTIMKSVTDWDEVLTGGGLSTLNTVTSSVDLTVGTTSGSKVIRQTFRHFNYSNGTGRNVHFSCNLTSSVSNNRKRFGVFTDTNGLFFELNGSTFNVVRRSDTTGSVVDSSVTQSNWNLDPLDGTGPSGLTLDVTKHHIYIINYVWLGAGRIRFGVNISGHIVYVHEMSFVNDLTAVYTKSGSLPIRYELENIGTAGSSSTLSIAGGVLYDTDIFNTNVNALTISTQSTPVSINTTPKVIAGIRLKPGTSFLEIKPLSFQLKADSGTGSAYFQVILRPTLTGDTWNSFSEITDTLTSTPTYTGGITLYEGYIELGSNSSRPITDVLFLPNNRLGYQINGTTDSLILVVRTISGNSSILFTGRFAELS